MALPLSNDLRERIVRAYSAGEGSYAELAARFQVGEASVSRILARHRKTGSVDPDPHGGGKPALIPDDELSVLHALVAKHSDATQQELVELWGDAMGVHVSRSVITRALRRAGLTRKKNDFDRGSNFGRTSKRKGRTSSS